MSQQKCLTILSVFQSYIGRFKNEIVLCNKLIQTVLSKILPIHYSDFLMVFLTWHIMGQSKKIPYLKR